MLSSEPNIQSLLSFVAVVLLSVFLISIVTRFVGAVSDKTTETHLGGGLVSGYYIGRGLDPEEEVIRELADLTTIIGTSELSFILFVLTIASYIELLAGASYILDKRGKIGLFGTVLVMLSGYLFPKIPEATALLLLIGIGFFYTSDKSEF